MEEKWGKEPLCDVKRGDGATRTACRIWIREGVERGNAKDAKRHRGSRKQEEKRGKPSKRRRFPQHLRCRKTRGEDTGKQKESQKEG